MTKRSSRPFRSNRCAKQESRFRLTRHKRQRGYLIIVDQSLQKTDMAYDLEEQEQIAELKQFWKQYGRLIVTVAVGALLAFAAMQGWRYYQNMQSQQASALFTKFAEAVRKNDVKDIRELGQQVMDRFGSTAYGPTAALLLAKTNFENGDPASAASQLQWAADHAKDAETAELARLRLAGIR